MADPTIRERLRELAEKATPGPWARDPHDDYLVDATGENIHWDHDGLGATWARTADAAFIVEAVNALPALLDQLDTLERRAIAATELLDTAQQALDLLTMNAAEYRDKYGEAASRMDTALIDNLTAALEASRGSA